MKQAAVVKSYKRQENEFCKYVRYIPAADIYTDAIFIPGHIIYKLKRNDGATLMLKARIALHGNENSQKLDLRTERSSCSPSRVRLALAVPGIYHWHITNADD